MCQYLNFEESSGRQHCWEENPTITQHECTTKPMIWICVITNVFEKDSTSQKITLNTLSRLKIQELEIAYLKDWSVFDKKFEWQNFERICREKTQTIVISLFGSFLCRIFIINLRTLQFQVVCLRIKINKITKMRWF